jgi:hypothetical protein
MDNIYIDTSIFEANNFLESKRIVEIFKLAEEGYLKIILPAITYKEVKVRASVNIKSAISRQKKFRDETRVLRNVPSIKEKYNLEKEEDILNEFLAVFDATLSRSKAVILDYPTVNISDVFEKYFNETFPFSRGEKKNEFPDAFALLSLEEWCRANKCKCFVFSNDKDLLGYKSSELTIVDSYEKFLDEKLRQIEKVKERERRIELVTKQYENNKQKLEAEVNNWIYRQLDDDRFYYRYTHLEVHHIDIQSYTSELSDFQIVSVRNDMIEIEARARISFRVEIEVDDEQNAYYDDEEKEWHYLDTTTEILEQDQIVNVLLVAEVPIAGDEYIEIEIEEINNGKDLQFRDYDYR